MKPNFSNTHLSKLRIRYEKTICANKNHIYMAHSPVQKLSMIIYSKYTVTCNITRKWKMTQKHFVPMVLLWSTTGHDDDCMRVIVTNNVLKTNKDSLLSSGMDDMNFELNIINKSPHFWTHLFIRANHKSYKSYLLFQAPLILY